MKKKKSSEEKYYEHLDIYVRNENIDLSKKYSILAKSWKEDKITTEMYEELLNRARHVQWNIIQRERKK